MLTSNLSELELLVDVLAGVGAVIGTIGGFAIKGWIKAAELERKDIARDIKEANDMISMVKAEMAGVKASDHIIFNRIDELKVAIANCVTRELYDKLQNEMNIRFESMVTSLSKQITDGFAQINLRIDRLSDRGN